MQMLSSRDSKSNVRKSNEIEHQTFSEFDFRTNRIQSNKSNSIHLIVFDWVRKPNSIEHNLIDWVRLALVNLYKASPSKQVFLVLFYTLFNNRNPIYKLSTAVKRTEENRTKLSLFPGAYSEIVVPFPFLANLQLRNDKSKGYFYAKIEANY